MARITVLVVGGTGESSVDDSPEDVRGVLTAVTRALDPRFVARWIPYPASYGPVPRLDGPSYGNSVRAGARSLRAAIAPISGPYTVIGYSQGCSVIRLALGAHRRRPAGTARLVGLGLVADPHQPAGAVPGCAGHGIAGDGLDLPASVPKMWIADPQDMICNASDDSLLRDVADLTRDLSMRDARRWAATVITAVRSHGMQNSSATTFSPGQWVRDVTRVRTAVREAAGYLPLTLRVGTVSMSNARGGRHDGYGRNTLPGTTDFTGCSALAAWLQVVATAEVGPRDDHVGEDFTGSKRGLSPAG